MKIIINYDFIERVTELKNRDKCLSLVKTKTRLWVSGLLPFYLLIAISKHHTDVLKVIDFVAFLYFLHIGIPTIVDAIGNLIRRHKNQENEEEIKDNEKSVIMSIEELYNYGIVMGYNFAKWQDDLEDLVDELSALNIKTDLETLLESYMYHKEVEPVMNNGLPEVMEKKYINIPKFSYNDELEEESIVQEHIVGSGQYVLTLGSPKPKTSLAYSGA